MVYATRHYRADGSDVEKCRYDVWFKGQASRFPRSAFPKYPTLFRRNSSFCRRTTGIVKPRFSAFFHTQVDLILRRLGVDTVILAGTTTPNCIRSSCYDALSLDYDVVVLSDCTSSVTDEVQRANLEDMARIGAKICTVDELSSLI